MNDYTDGSEVSAEDTFFKDASWSLQFAWLPHRCDITGKEIWFEWAYRGINKALSPLRAYSRWITRDTWLVEKLKGTI
jgi:hypothetical protein